MFNSNASSAAGDANYIEDVFSSWLYTGNNATQTITNGIDLSTKGGMIWFKPRDVAASHVVFDTLRGPTKFVVPNSASFGEITNTAGNDLTSFNTNGFSLGTSQTSSVNVSGTSQVSWTFREQPKFFDVVTYTGTGSNRTVAHALGSVPGCIMVKRTDTAGDWQVYHRANTANPETDYLVLNTDAATADSDTRWNDTQPTDAVFSLGTEATVNASGGTYVAYLFAHNAGGFGLTGTDNVISCGSYTGTGVAGLSVTLGYEPQWLLIKRSNGVSEWPLMDSMRGIPTGSADVVLRANTTNADITAYDYASLTATGFQLSDDIDVNTSGGTYIYIAIRRGPMKVPTTGTSVFAPVNQTGGGTVTTNFPVDLLISTTPSQTSYRSVNDRLRGASTTTDVSLYTNRTDAEVVSAGYGFGFDNNTGFKDGVYTNSFTDLYLSFRRSPGFFDEVCYTGNGGNMTISHNLGVAPTLMIVKGRNATGAGQWRVYDVFDGNDNYMALNTTAATASGYGAYWNTTTPTSSVFYVGSANTTNTGTYVAYLFATCDGVSKVGSYTGTAAAQTINCGFTAGARFVLIKRTDSTGDWYVWDSARGIIAGNDPYLLLNNDVAEVTGTDYVDTAASGFELTATAPAAINASGGSYLFLAIA